MPVTDLCGSWDVLQGALANSGAAPRIVELCPVTVLCYATAHSILPQKPYSRQSRLSYAHTSVIRA